MKTEEFKRKLIEEIYLNKWVKNGTWKWNKDNSVTVLGDLIVDEYNAKEFNVKFKEVTGKFQISLPISLKNLENYPKSVGRYVFYSRIRNIGTKSNKEYKKLLKEATEHYIEKLKRNQSV